jgi:hypothetical protein
MALQQPKAFEWSDKAQKICLGLIAVGVLGFAVGLYVDPQRAWANFLLEYFYWLAIACAGIFFAALQHISGATWSIPVRRVGELFIAYLPVAAVLFVVLLFGVHTLYEWTHADVVAHDPILSQKASYLNVPFFVIRSVVFFALMFFGGGWLVKNSLRQDVTGDAKLSALNVKISAPFIILFAWLFSFVSFDLLMSLTPHWFSTIFGVYCWSGLFYSGLAMMTLWTIVLRRRGCVDGYVTTEHYHGMGKLMWAFLVFWAYIGFSQYMLIWYANIPEETPYMIVRSTGAWNCVSIALMVCKFGLPFFFIISQGLKRRERWLFAVTIWFLAAQWLDVYWMVFPTFFDTPVFGWMELSMLAGFSGAFFLSVGRKMSKVPVVAYRDPQILEGVHHHQ